MSTRTLGTNGTTTLTALSYQPAANASGTEQMADFATIAQAILDDGAWPAGGTRTNNLAVQDWKAANTRGPFNGAFQLNGLLYIPNRGVLRVLPGDFVGVDANGWPILVAAAAIAGTYASTSWTHT